MRDTRDRTPRAPYRRIGLALAFLCGAAVDAPSAFGQAEDCEALRQQMAEASDVNRATEYDRAAQRQQIELQRTQAYADQIGCGGFSIFSDAPPGQCDAIEGRIRRMQGNLDALAVQADRFRRGDPNRQAALEARYNAACTTGYSTPVDPNGWDSMQPGFDNGDQSIMQEDQPRSVGKPICVRTCDGGYFPLGASASDRTVDGLQSLCTALCPNTEAKLYTTPDTDNLGGATAVDGSAYSSLPNAFRFQKTFDATCSCKPAGKSWVEALAQAESLLEKGDKDVTVTSQMSDQMARPVAATPIPSKKKPAKTKSTVDLQAAAENALGAQAPTASSDSAGIASAASPADRTVRTGQGQVKDVPGPDGVKRRVRIIGPLL